MPDRIQFNFVADPRSPSWATSTTCQQGLYSPVTIKISLVPKHTGSSARASFSLPFHLLAKSAADSFHRINSLPVLLDSAHLSWKLFVFLFLFVSDPMRTGIFPQSSAFYWAWHIPGIQKIYAERIHLYTSEIQRWQNSVHLHIGGVIPQWDFSSPKQRQSPASCSRRCVFSAQFDGLRPPCYWFSNLIVL